MTSINQVYDSSKKQSPALIELKELFRYRDLLKLLISGSIKTRYKRSALGVVWTVLNPLLNTLVLSIAFSFLFKFQVKNYAIYILVGLLFWQFFSQATNHSMNRLVWGSSLIKKIYIPRTVFAISVIANSVINYAITMIPLALIMLVMKHPFRLSLVMLPVILLILTMFTLGSALLLSTIAVFFVDFIDMYSVFLRILYFLTPIIYPLSIVPEKYQPVIIYNPLYQMMRLFRTVIYDGEFPSVQSLAINAGIAIVTLIIGWFVFTQKSDEFTYRI